MGAYFNPGNESMKQAVNSRIYIDKTGLLKHTNQVLFSEQKCIAVSHARRFGKSQAAGMIDAYYSKGSDSKELFSPFEISKMEDFSMLKSRQLTKYFGFTEDEVKALCLEYDMDFDTIKEWYNGYLIDGQHMYNPNSVFEAMVNRDIDSYWKNTSSFSTINQYITMNFDGLKEDILSMLAGEPVYVDVETFTNDLSEISCKDEALTALIHLGYLAYDSKESEAYIPNFEVAKAYHSALKKGTWTEVAKSISRCEEILRATRNGESERVAELMDLAHSAYTSILKYNDENALSCVVTMAYFTAPAYCNVIRELPSGKGFADIAFIPRKDYRDYPAMLIELKWNKNADTAIKQIKERKYVGKLNGYGDKILLVGINYDKDSKDKKHECVIEEWMPNKI